MNTLSWMLYLAGVAGGLKALLMIFGIVSTTGLIPATIFRIEGSETAMWLFPKLAIAGPLLLLLAVLTPTKTTVYAIAASELGERALHTPTATKAFRALDAWLDRQIAKPEPEL